MPSLTDKQIADLVAGTQRELGRMRFGQIAQTLQDYEMMGRWLKKDKVIFDDGYGIERTLMTKLAGSAKHVGQYEEDELNIRDLLEKMHVDWVHAQTHWAFERRETLMNRGKSLVVKVVEPRRAGAMIDMADLLEEATWTLPTPGDDTVPKSVPYWIVPNATEGFTGGCADGYDDVGGIDPDVTTTWKNYSGTYTAVTKADLIKKLRKAFRKIKFKSPVSIPDFRRGKGDRYRLYMNEETISDMEDLGEAQNENLGRDLASMDGVMTFKRCSLNEVPYLTSDTKNPVYLIDHSTFYPVVLRGDYLRETTPEKAAKMHNTFVVFVDLTYNFICVDRRSNAVLTLAS